ncbi:hypothetical protein [Pseudoalteromonas espejiana]|uniref:Lipoyl-binding domain-containing protein n=1 Tax=Pseudoalteromonas espejiana TaxID=28107 RepID=A0A510XY89_9GAMM|nr:hypothetical protein [Pseudoalteromonas espejiana]GEK56010.1 hypothetical protein PES01_28550 [Pseudoalteromonas espejiana]
MFTINLFLAVTFSATLNINTPEIQEYLYSREQGEILEIYVSKGDKVKKQDPLILYIAAKEEKYLNSTFDGIITYSSEFGSKSFFRQGELLFKIKSKAVYAVLSSLSTSNFESFLKVGTLICSEEYNSPFEVFRVNNKTILVSMKLNSDVLQKHVTSEISTFYICNQ